MILKYNDKVHGYWLDGTRCKGVSTCASIPDDRFSLDQWRKRMVAIGVANNSELADAVRYAETVNNNGLLNDLAEQAMDEAGAHLAAAAGTADHTLTEKADTGQSHEENERLTVARWNGLLDYAGIDIDLEYIERVVVYPERKLCGRFDRFGRRRSDGRLVAIDLKTGSSAVRYPHSVATQLAMYANADLLAGEMEYAGEGKSQTDEFLPMPSDLDLKVGYMLYVPQDGEAQIFAVNIAKGWKAVQDVIFPTLDWRDTRDIIKAI